MRATAPPRGTRRPAARRLAVLGALAALALPATTPALAQSSEEGPTLQVTPAGDLDAAGETITVSGTGFDPAANVGTRPPFAGLPSGFYVVYGSFEDTWRPSDGAASSARPVTSQVWVLPAASRAVLDPTSTNPELATLAADGSFSFTLDVAPIEDGTGTSGIYSYAGSGAVNPDHELTVPITFATEDPDTDDPDTDDPDTDPDPDPDPDPDTDPDTEPDTDDPDDGDPDGDADGRTVTDGHLDWGVKDSFRSYVTGPIAGGTATTSDGATTTDTGTFRFSSATGTYDPDTGQVQATAADPGDLDVATAGTVRFQGHGGLLDLTLTDPAVTLDGDDGLLTLDARSRGLEDPDEVYEGDDIPFAELDLADTATTFEDGILTLTAIPATLTEEGAEAFAGFYEPGEELDPITLVLAVDDAQLPRDETAEPADPDPADEDPGAGGPTPTPTVAAAGQLPRTGTPSTPGLVALGLLLIVAGTAARRLRPTA